MSTSEYTQEFCDRAVELTLQGHHSVAIVVRKLGVNVRRAGRPDVSQRYHVYRNRPGRPYLCDEHICRLPELPRGGVADVRYVLRPYVVDNDDTRHRATAHQSRSREGNVPLSLRNHLSTKGVPLHPSARCNRSRSH